VDVGIERVVVVDAGDCDWQWGRSVVGTRLLSFLKLNYSDS